MGGLSPSDGKYAKTICVMWIITGGAGFIGSVLLAKLNGEGRDDLLVVDRLERSEKWKNLRHKRFKDYLEADPFLDLLTAGKLGKIEGIVHLGACSSTTETDASFLIRNNYEFTKKLAVWALAKKKRFIYASSGATYGDGSLGYRTDDGVTSQLKPLNMYGFSKHLFDLWALQHNVLKKMVGVKFFNIYGPNEYHKEDMRSVVVKAFEQIRKDNRAELFRSYHPDYKDGEQKRDFLYVKDAVDVVYSMMTDRRFGGLYNVGSGRARSWNDLVGAIFGALGRPAKIEYVDMPAHLRSKYQYFTQAEMAWRPSNAKPFRSLEEGVRDYVQTYLSKDDPYL
jgi:ADP-L-glycero-D-manno-heptose 6-epimerase